MDPLLVVVALDESEQLALAIADVAQHRCFRAFEALALSDNYISVLATKRKPLQAAGQPRARSRACFGHGQGSES